MVSFGSVPGKAFRSRVSPSREQPRKTMSKDVDTASFVLYQSQYGESWHREPTCATDAEVPPQLDCAASLFEGLEMSRFGELDADADLCANCAKARIELNAKQIEL